MEFIRDGDDASGLTSTPQFPVTEDKKVVNDGHGLPSQAKQRDDDVDVEFQRHLEERQNDDEERPSYMHFIPFLVITAIVLLAMPSILGAYRPKLVKILPHSSILIEDINPLIREYMTVEREYGATKDLILFGFDKKPPLNVVANWSENHKETLTGDGEKVEWTYFLHEGSMIDITYNMTSSIKSRAYLEITEGASSPNIFLGLYAKRLLGGTINGTGKIRQHILESGNYHIRVFNEIIDIVEVELQIKVKGIVHNTSTAYYKCSVSRGTCHMKIPFARSHSVLLAFDNPKLSDGDDDTCVVVSFKPRWLAYLIFIGGLVVVLTCVGFLFLRKPRRTIAKENISMEIINRRTIEESQGAL